MTIDCNGACLQIAGNYGSDRFDRELVQYVKQSIMLKNWPDLLGLLHDYIAQAEQKFDNGADRKQWVMSMIQATANRVNYPLDMNLIGALIDDLCKLTKEVNVGVKAAGNGHD